MNSNASTPPAIRIARVASRNDLWSPAPLNLPHRASAAKAIPSMKNENSVNSCISSAFTASISAPCIDPTRVNHMVTATRHSVRRNISALMRKNSRSLPPSNTSPNVTFIHPLRRTHNHSPSRNPAHCAVSVPNATPVIRSFSPNTSARLTNIFSTSINIDTHIGVRESCIPTNHPVSTNVPNTAGAPHIQIEK